ncbi:MAG: hypothetical protein JSR45_16065 [Proteobacteria bacterium]|nr:hypothetical protein [Pseudomonadota bacterium]
MTDLLNGELENIANVLGAAAALGTAAFGLVDVSKAFWGGPSNIGFGYIARATRPFAPALLIGGGEEWLQTLRAQWLNGAPAADQKAKAKGLIRLGLTSENAAEIAVAGRVDPQALQTAVTKIERGTPLKEEDLNVLGRLDAVVEATLDAAFGRADQQYRNAAKGLAALTALVLAVIAGAMIFDAQTHTLVGYLASRDLLIAVMMGVIAVPIAPVAKDLASSLATAVNAVRVAKG